MFITDEDYRTVCTQKELEVISQSDEKIRERAQASAMEEAASYLRSKYDMNRAYSATDGERNPQLVQVVANISLYYLVHNLPGNMAKEGRTILYENAIEWLKTVQSGKASPNLPGYEDDENNPSAYPIFFGSMKKNRYDY